MVSYSVHQDAWLVTYERVAEAKEEGRSLGVDLRESRAGPIEMRTANEGQCQCNASGMTLSIENCPGCGTPRCTSCDVHKQTR